MTGFEKRPFGRTALEVTALGLGCATLGGTRVPVSREEAEATVRAAWAAGARYVDTAPFYGFGRAERCVGDALRDEPRDEWVLSTKVGRLLCPNPSTAEHRQNRMPFDQVFDYSYEAIMRSFEDSLQKLGLGRIDILYVHDIGAMQHRRESHPAIMRTLRVSGYRALEELRRCGVMRAIGIGVNEREVLLEALEWGAWDAFLLAWRYTLLEQAPLDDLLPKCLSPVISIVVRGPPNSGSLSGRDTCNYTAAPSEIVGRVDAIRAVCDCHQVPLAAGRVAISARPPCGRGDHPGSVHRPGIRGQPEPLALSDSLSVVERPARSKAASPARADARLISWRPTVNS
jgi:D-threo-aldose 1-dehydrogenase